MNELFRTLNLIYNLLTEVEKNPPEDYQRVFEDIKWHIIRAQEKWGNYYPIGYITLEDLYEAGYDVHEITGDTMEELSEKLENRYKEWGSFGDDLESVATEELQVPKRK
jgi:hypothetical protein